jgi:hypothetical protein
MGKILIFNCSPQRIRRSFTAGHSAQILFFTGVRYVPYIGDVPEPSPQPNRPSRSGLNRRKRRA